MENYKVILSEVAKVLKTNGFKRSGDSFFFHDCDNIGLIGFQRRKISVDVSSFTINIGIYSSALKIFDQMDVELKPVISDCHWRKRIGFLMAQKTDHWWTISSSTNLLDEIKEIVFVVTSLAIPEVKKYLSDESLVESWMNDISSGLSTQQMLLYLVAMLKFRNDDAYFLKLEELKVYSKGKPFQQNINECLLKIGINE